MKLDVLNLDGVKLLAKTTYAGRRTDTPLFSITKAGNVALNTAFKQTYYPKHNNKLFIQAVCVKNVYYILLSTKKKPSYYSLSYNTDSTGFNGAIQSLKTLFGKKGLAMRYTTELVPTSDATIKAFKLRHVAEDLFTTKEESNFEIA